MKKKLKYILFSIISIFILIFFLKFFLKKDEKKAFDYLEETILSIYEEDEKRTLLSLEKAYMSNDEDIYQVINELVPVDVLEKFYKNKFSRSKGNAEYGLGLKLIFSNKIGEGIEALKKSSSQNNIYATYFLANYLYSLKRFEESYKYFEKSYKLNDYRVTEIYEHIKKNLTVYKEIEKLNLKYNQNTITDYERLYLGKFLLDILDVEFAYKVLKPYLEENNPDALYAKALYLESELEIKEAIKIYEKLVNEFKYPAALLKLIDSKKLLQKKSKKYIIDYIDNLALYNKGIYFLKAKLLFETDNWKEAKKIYDNLYLQEYIPVYIYLAKYYEDIDNIPKAIKYYELAFKNGELSASLNLDKLKFENSNKYLKLASKLGDSEASMRLSQKSKDLYEKKKYAIISLSQGNLKSLETLIDIAHLNNEKNKVRVYTNVLINN